MPSQFEQMFSDSLDGLYDEFGLPAIYTGPDGQTINGTVRVHRNESHEVDRNSHVSGELQTGELLARQSEFAKVVKDGRFTVEGVEVWTVATTPTVKNGQHHCNCMRSGMDRMRPRRAKE